jgi:hypothetical protein
MTWWDDAHNDATAIVNRERLIVDQQDETFRLLWKELLAQLEDGKRFFPDLFTNGQEFSRSIKLPVSLATTKPLVSVREVQVTLHRKEHQIIVSGHTVDLEIVVDVCDDGVICLKVGDQVVSMAEVATDILRRFAFPQLYEPVPKPGVY